MVNDCEEEIFKVNRRISLASIMSIATLSILFSNSAQKYERFAFSYHVEVFDITNHCTNVILCYEICETDYLPVVERSAVATEIEKLAKDSIKKRDFLDFFFRGFCQKQKT